MVKNDRIVLFRTDGCQFREADRGHSFGVDGKKVIARRHVLRDGKIKSRGGADCFVPLHPERGRKTGKLQRPVLGKDHQIRAVPEEFRKTRKKGGWIMTHCREDDALRRMLHQLRGSILLPDV